MREGRQVTGGPVTGPICRRPGEERNGKRVPVTKGTVLQPRVRSGGRVRVLLQGGSRPIGVPGASLTPNL